MKKYLILVFLSVLFTGIMAAEYTIDLQNDGNGIQLLRNDYDGMQMSFHFDGINHINVETKKGMFSELIIPQAYGTGELGTPNLPVAKKLIEVPWGADLDIQVLSYDVEEFKLSDFGIQYPIMPAQPSLRKDMDAASVKFEYQEKAYQKNTFTRNEIASATILGTMRSMRLARLEVAPVEYNPVTGIIRVYNNIDVKIQFRGATIAEQEYAKKATASPYFSVVYDKIMNSLDRDSYDDHPDLLTYPVKYLIVSDPMFEDQLQPFIQWKAQKGFNVITAYTDEIGTSYNNIQTWIHDQYNSGTPEDPAPSFLLLVGDTPQIPAQMGSESSKMTDLYYASVDGDMFPEMYYGRLSATNESQLQPQIDKILYYEKYEFDDPSYLDNATLIAGEDGTWNPRVGQPTVEYGTENYFNTANGYNEVHAYLNSYGGCYDTVNQGVGFINYTAHGSQTSWAGPSLNISDVYNFNNVNQPTFAIGNCCLSADFGYGECFGEAWLRADNAAVGYIASSPSSYWFEDFYWAVGAFPISGTNDGYVPSYEETTWGSLDGPFVSDYLAMDATVFIGNLAVTEVHANSYPSHSSPTYYWQAYNLLGDPSVFPYFRQAELNTVQYMDVLPIGIDTFDVTAEPGSYVAISFEGELKGTAFVDASGTVSVPLNPIYDGGMADIVVTAPGLQPYIAQVLVAPLDSAFMTIDEVTVIAGDDDIIEFGETVQLTVVAKNVGTEPATNVTMLLSIDDDYITLTDDSEGVGTVDPDGMVTLTNSFEFTVSNDIPNEYSFHFDVSFVGDQDTWENGINLVGYAPELSISDIAISDDDNNMLDPGDRADIVVTIMNDGGAKAYNLEAILSSTSDLISFNENTDTATMIEAGGTAEVTFDIDVSSDAEIGDVADFLCSVSGNNDISFEEIFSLSIGLIVEDFETGDFSAFPWEFFGASQWTVDGSDVYEGEFSANSGDVNHNQFNSLSIQLYVTQNDEISFWKKVSSENNYDFLKFYIDDAEIGSWSGDVAWSEEIFDVTIGDHIFKWEYEKDGSVDGGSDTAWIDYIIFPPSIVPDPAELVVNPLEFNVSLTENDTHTEVLSLSNIGDIGLDYGISLQNTTEEAGKNLTGSTVTCDVEGFYPGETVTWTFSVTCASDDNEWIKDVWIEFPSGILINSSTDLVGGSSDIPTDGCTGDGVTVHWGGSGYISNGQTATADVSVTIGSGFVGDATLPWILHGDEWGSDPHEISGEMVINSLGEPMTWVVLSSSGGTLNANETDEIDVTFDTTDLDEGTYTANIIITHTAGEDVVIPVVLNVGEVDSPGDVIPAVTQLKGNYPNPFNPTTTIRFDLNTNANVDLAIYNVKGQKIRTLINDEVQSGSHHIVWDGKDDHQVQTSSGIYFYRFTTSSGEDRYTATKKMILMK